MPPPLKSDGQVTYAPGNPKPTVDQMAQDVAAFLAWTAEPRLENRHSTGLAVSLFLLLATILAYMAYQNIWHGPGSRRVRATGPLDPENMAKRDAASAQGLDG
jgi:ubiquinol-cytochrome c reductase cytochrome c1 subunit